MSAAQFYDGLADTYHALYPDWRNAGMVQAEALHRLLCRWHREPADIADVACGIGTQLIGLATLHESHRQNVVYAATAGAVMPRSPKSACMSMRRFS
jgi:hypothetical protein